MRKTRIMFGAALAAACLSLGTLPAFADDAPGTPPASVVADRSETTVALAAAAASSQTFDGTFKASLRSKDFSQFSDQKITVKIKPTNCTSGYPTITVKLYNVTILTNTWQVGATKSVPCNALSTISWSSPGRGGYQLQFDRTGPAGKDENSKHVTGTISYTP